MNSKDDRELDLIDIKHRVNRAYLPERDDHMALCAAMGDIKRLIAEVERLRQQLRKE